ncbi:MAG: flagellar hook assembly protein FlgD [Kiloniellales bacterium]|nr:flagellar hook assembly protein FlgD [Kiloniellales bacterium]
MEINGVPLLELQPPGSSTTNLTETFDNFLTLLTTQLQNQDPLEPLDTNQFTDQLVQFANVEQAINTNTKLDQLIAAQGGNQLTGALDYIGKTVTVEGTGLDLVDGGATLAYDLSGAASAVTVLVLDSLGQPVASLKGPSGTGPQEIVWDGKDDQGNQLPDGSYSFSVQALDGQGDPVALTQGSVGKVSGIELVNGEVILSVGSLQVSLSQILSVRAPAGGGA